MRKDEYICYVIDTSSLIEMKDKYPRDVSLFKPIWENVEKLCRNGRLIAPIEVLKEIEQGDDELKRWSKNRRKIFIKPDESQFAKISEILNTFSFLAKSEKLGPNADPWVIALAVEKNEEGQKVLFPNKYIVVTEESKTKPNKIPAVCKNYNIECVNLIELFRREGW